MEGPFRSSGEHGCVGHVHTALGLTTVPATREKLAQRSAMLQSSTLTCPYFPVPVLAKPCELVRRRQKAGSIRTFTKHGSLITTAGYNDTPNRKLDIGRATRRRWRRVAATLKAQHRQTGRNGRRWRHHRQKPRHLAEHT